MSRLWRWLAAGLGGLAVLLGGLLALTSRGKLKAEHRADTQRRRADHAEAGIETRAQADQASQQAKQQGDQRVDQVRQQARDGRRDHFESDSLHDD